MQTRTVYFRGGYFEAPITTTYLSRGAHIPCPVGTVYSGVVLPGGVLPKLSGVTCRNLPDVALSFEEYGRVFRRPDRERQKELNQEHRASYSPKSWFGKALQDKLGTNLAMQQDRVKHAFKRGKIDAAERDRRLASLEATTLQAVQERLNYEKDLQVIRRQGVELRREAAKRWKTNSGPALPKGEEPTPLIAVATRYLPQSLVTGVYQGRVIVHGTGGYNRRGSIAHPDLVRDEDCRHGHVSTGMANMGRRGRGDLHNGAPMSKREEKALDLAQFALDVQAAEKLALELCGKPGGKKAHKSALNKRRAYEMALKEFKAGGIMGRLHAFEAFNGKARSSRGKAAAEKIKEEGRKDYK